MNYPYGISETLCHIVGLTTCHPQIFTGYFEQHEHRIPHPRRRGRDNALLVLYPYRAGELSPAVRLRRRHPGDAAVCGDPAHRPLLFSHLHMDHVGGFDSYFRCAYNRTLKPNSIWGPPETARIMHHRFQGFLWNLCQDRKRAGRYAMSSRSRSPARASSCRRPSPWRTRRGAAIPDGTLIETADFTVDAVHMEHLTPVLALHRAGEAAAEHRSSRA